MRPSGIITLLTDFGYRDGFVGTMKGVILGINPHVHIVDIAHDIAPGDIEAAAFVLNGAYPYFPKGTIHTIVVDPGVGSQRKAIATEIGNYYFIAPDNGVLSWVLQKEECARIIELSNTTYHLPKTSHTFHGRDVFAPAAAHLSAGVPLVKLGRPAKGLIQKIPKPAQKKEDAIYGEVIYIDRFGNLITNIPEELLIETNAFPYIQVVIGEQIISGLRSSYSEVERNQVLAIIGSFGFLEIAVRDGNAAERLKAQQGAQVKVLFVRK